MSAWQVDPTVTATVLLTYDEKAALERLAADLHLEVGEVLRGIVCRHIAWLQSRGDMNE